MRIKQIKIYSYDELPEGSRIKAIDHFGIDNETTLSELIYYIRQERYEFLEDGTIYKD